MDPQSWDLPSDVVSRRASYTQQKLLRNPMDFFLTSERPQTKTDRPPSRPIRCISHENIDLIHDERRGTAKSFSKYGKRQFVPQLLAFARRRTLLLALLTVCVSGIALRPLLRVFAMDPGLHEPSTRSLDLQKIVSSLDMSNPRTKGLLQILRQNRIPDFLSVHQGKALPLDATSCIVTAYFRVKSKYADEKYENDWMGNILSLQDCMIIFCEEHMVESMLKARAHHPTVVLAMELDNLPVAHYIGPNHDTATAFWQHQLELDPERKLHKSYQLFWIWLSKTWFVVVASLLQESLFQTNRLQTFMWADIGSFRNGSYSGKRLLRYPQSLLRPHDTRTVVWMAHHTPNPPKSPYWNQKLKKTEKQHFYHSGSHGIASTVEAWVHYYVHFVETFDQYATRGLFVGEDQCVLQTTCLLHPETCAYLPFDQVNDNHYFGLRHALHYGNRGKNFDLWHPPAAS